MLWRKFVLGMIFLSKSDGFRTVVQIRGGWAHFRLSEFWTKSDWLRPFGTILDSSNCFGPFWTILTHLDQNGQNGHKWSKTVPNGPKWSQMVPNCPKWPFLVQIRPKWSKKSSKALNPLKALSCSLAAPRMHPLQSVDGNMPKTGKKWE